MEGEPRFRTNTDMVRKAGRKGGHPAPLAIESDISSDAAIVSEAFSADVGQIALQDNPDAEQ